VGVLERNNVHVEGAVGGRPMLLAHGFGCDQEMWRFVWPAFAEDHRIVLFDHVGHGGSDLGAWSSERYATLNGYAQDVLEICEALELEDVVFVGHSVSAMIGALAAREAPERFGALVMIGPSPRYADAPGYTGGFAREDLEDLLVTLESNYLGWSSQMAPVIAGNPDRPEFGAELTERFCRTDPQIAAHFARVTFLSDNREDLPHVPTRSLVLQCSQDAIAPEAVGRYVAETMPAAEFVQLAATGHCPNLSAPDETVEAMRRFLDDARGG
jgi:sigma-B regulation protein RsbQ